MNGCNLILSVGVSKKDYLEALTASGEKLSTKRTVCGGKPALMW